MSQKNINGSKKLNLFRGVLLTRIEPLITEWMSRNSNLLLRISLGIVFVWFGFLKFFPGLSPAEDLAIRTVKQLSFDLISDSIIINTLGFWEVVVGIGLISGKFMRETLLLLFLQMAGTFAPIFLFPNEIFTHFPYGPTLEGQYIIKNLVLISAAIVLGGKLSKSSIELKKSSELKKV
ncbi:MAG: putative membrane protein YkgB [Dokdonia sp.]|jgi:uncharacterized membrane protein YkgB